MEIHIIIMDRNLKSYRKLAQQEGLNSILDLLNKCREVKGIFTLIWHSTPVYKKRGRWFKKVYVETITYGANPNEKNSTAFNDNNNSF